MPVLNGQAYIGEAVESILGQTFQDFELLIIDGGSTDRTPDIVGSYRDPRIRLLRTRLNLIESLNEGLDRSRGEYIARMDADDIALPSRFEEQVGFLSRRPDHGMVGSAFYLMNADGKVVGRNVSYHKPWWIAWCLMFGNVFSHPTVMLRRSVLTKLGLRYGSMPVEEPGSAALPADIESEDYLLWLMLSAQTKLDNLQRPLLRLRKHELGKSRRNTDRIKNVHRSISAWSLSRKSGYTVPAKSLGQAMADGRVDWLEQVFDDLAGRHACEWGLSGRERALLMQDGRIRALATQAKWPGVLQRGWELARVFSKTTLPLTANHGKSALRYLQNRRDSIDALGGR